MTFFTLSILLSFANQLIRLDNGTKKFVITNGTDIIIQAQSTFFSCLFFSYRFYAFYGEARIPVPFPVLLFLRFPQDMIEIDFVLNQD